MTDKEKLRGLRDWSENLLIDCVKQALEDWPEVGHSGPRKGCHRFMLKHGESLRQAAAEYLKILDGDMVVVPREPEKINASYYTLIEERSNVTDNNFEQGLLSFPSDMHPKSYLGMLVQDDGDVCLQIFDAERMSTASVEFCTASIGGGRNKLLHDALYDVFAKIKKAMIAAGGEDETS